MHCRRFVLSALTAALVFAASGPASAAQPALTPAERAFYATASATLEHLYPTPAAAEKAGWFRYTNEDDSGAISYVNPKYFATPDVRHPQELWYDAHGRLLGADFSQLHAPASAADTIFHLSPGRLQEVPLHIHYGVVRHGVVTYGLYLMPGDFTAAGLDPLHPSKADLVTLHKVKAAADVAFVFANLHNWDAQMWLIPNAAGQFADTNPAVKRSTRSTSSP